MKLYLLGGGGHCRACIDVVESEGRYEIAGILDVPGNVGQKLSGYDIIGTDADIPKLVGENVYFLLTVGQIRSPDVRVRLSDQVTKSGGRFATVVSPYAIVSSRARIGEGTIVMHQAVVNTHAGIGRHVILNTRSLVEHDSTVGDFCHISTGAVVNGGVTVGERTFFGSTAVCSHGAVIPAGSFVKANETIS